MFWNGNLRRIIRQLLRRARQTTENLLARNPVINVVTGSRKIDDTRLKLAVMTSNTNTVESEAAQNDALRMNHLQLLQQVPAQVDPVEPVHARNEEEFAADEFAVEKRSQP